MFNITKFIQFKSWNVPKFWIFVNNLLKMCKKGYKDIIGYEAIFLCC